MNPTLLILAAGIGSRYGGLKQIDKLGPSGEAIIDYSIYDAIRAGFGKVVFVIRQSIEKEIREFFLKKLSAKINVDFVIQDIKNVPKGIKISPKREKPWGTGHAVWVSEQKINEPFAVINADDFYGAESYKIIANYLSSSQNNDNANYCMIGYDLINTLSDFGSVSRGICEIDNDNFLKSVTEKTQIEKIPNGIVYKDEEENLIPFTGKEIVSMNIWGFTPSIFSYLEFYFNKFIHENSESLKAEFFIPSIINAIVNNKKARLKVLESKNKWFGITYKEDKENAIQKIRELINTGVYPENLWE
ncbi:MAG: nucleotidyltransferase [Bacteroidales bacterium]|nr:nucleotidyltransferase [Bacteroidales bacterium]